MFLGHASSEPVAPAHSVYYSKSCLCKAGFLLKPTGYATSEIVMRGVPWAAEGLGLGERAVREGGGRPEPHACPRIEVPFQAQQCRHRE